MAKDKNYIIGIDLGGTKTLTVLFDRKFKPVSEVKVKTKPQKGDRFLMQTLRGSVAYVLEEAGVHRSDVLGIGVGCPGIIQASTGTVLLSPNINFLKRYPLASKLSAETKLPVTVHNDVKMGLYGEHQLGAAKGFRHVVGLFMGTGIGGALILDGQLYTGSFGAAGEIGHITVDPLGPICGCGKRGCFEALASRLAIASEAAVMASKQQAPTLFKDCGTDLANIKSSALAEAVRKGDKAIIELMRVKSRLIGDVMGMLVNVLNPDAFVLGGGLVEAMPQLVVREAQQAMLEKAMSPLGSSVRVMPARLGDYAVAAGAAKWAEAQMRANA